MATWTGVREGGVREGEVRVREGWGVLEEGGWRGVASGIVVGAGAVGMAMSGVFKGGQGWAENWQRGNPDGKQVCGGLRQVAGGGGRLAVYGGKWRSGLLGQCSISRYLVISMVEV